MFGHEFADIQIQMDLRIEEKTSLQNYLCITFD